MDQIGLMPASLICQARQVHVWVNDRIITPAEGFLVRKGPGNCHFDFAQEISFTPSNAGPVNQG